MASSNHQQQARPAQSFLSDSCTHRNLTRIYDQSDCQKCTNCLRTPHLGYLYRCTQDTRGHLTMSDFIDGNVVMNMAGLRVTNDATSPLFQQSTETSTPSHASANAFAAQATHDTNENNSDDSENGIDEELAQAYDGKRRHEVAFPPGPAHSPNTCGLRICHTCRPTFRDRAWQSIDQIVNNPVDPPSHQEFENRRISNATVVMGIDPTGTANKRPRTATTVDSTWERPVRNPNLEIGAIWVDPTDRFCRNTYEHMHRAIHSTLQDHSGSDADDEKGFAMEDDSESMSSDESEYRFNQNIRESTSTVHYPHGPTPRPSLSNLAANNNQVLMEDTSSYDEMIKEAVPAKKRFIID